MDLGKAFSYVFDDEQWLSSILIGGLIFLIPIVGPLALLGYMLEAARNVATGNPRPLPRWNNFGEKLSLGFAGFVISLVYSLPLILVMMALICFPILAASGARSEEAAAVTILGSLGCIVPLIIVLSILIQPVLLAAMVRYLQTGSLGEAFRVGEVIATVRADLGSWLILWLLSLLCGFIASLGGTVLIGIIFTYPYSQAIFGHLMGQMMTRVGSPLDTGYPPQPLV